MGNKRNILLYPLSLLYGLITSFRNFLYDSEILQSHKFKIPVICVGNITVGGTGKTPHTEYLVRLLHHEFKVAVLSRGYRRKTRGFLFAGKNSTVSDIGDESLQISRKFPEITVAVDSNRVRGVENIMRERPDTSVIILDDGYQHRKIKAGLSILLTDIDRLIISDYMLPYGNLREDYNNKNRADVILITKSPAAIPPIQRRLIIKDIRKAPFQKLYFTSICYSEPQPVFEKSADHIDILRHPSPGTGIVLVTGIANPATLYDHLKKSFDEIIHLSFSDHHRFTPDDLEKIPIAWNNIRSAHKCIITTEKDAVRLREFTNFTEEIESSFFYIPVVTCFLNGCEDEFDNLIVDYVRKNK
jgi:tetraacyldisaccharide 4'-kinase